MTSLTVHDVSKQFVTRGETLSVLRGVSFELHPGQNLGILGPSGSGKSTLLHILGTLESPTSGAVTLDGVDPFGLSETEQARFRNRQIGFVFQDHHLLPQCSVLENVLIPTLAWPRNGSDCLPRARRLIDAIGLARRIHHRP